MTLQAIEAVTGERGKEFIQFDNQELYGHKALGRGGTWFDKFCYQFTKPSVTELSQRGIKLSARANAVVFANNKYK